MFLIWLFYLYNKEHFRGPTPKAGFPHEYAAFTIPVPPVAARIYGSRKCDDSGSHRGEKTIGCRTGSQADTRFPEPERPTGTQTGSTVGR